MLPNNGNLLNGFLRSKLLNDPFASCSFINLDFLLPHTVHSAQFDNNISLPFLFFSTSEFKFLYRFAFQTVCQHILYSLVNENSRINIIPITFSLCFCVKLLYLSDIQSALLDTSLITLFVIVIFLTNIISVFFTV